MNVKKRYWAMVLYPESAPPTWREDLQVTGLPCAVSPLHDKDINSDNTPKKAHYHIILCYENPTTFKNVKENITDKLGQPIPIPLENVRGYYRYLIHADNPEKYQYNEWEITSINGFNYRDYADLTLSQNVAILKEITKLIDDNDILEYHDFINLIRDNDFYTQFLDIAMHNTIFINTYITSKRHSFLKNS